MHLHQAKFECQGLVDYAGPELFLELLVALPLCQSDR